MEQNEKDLISDTGPVCQKGGRGGDGETKPVINDALIL